MDNTIQTLQSGLASLAELAEVDPERALAELQQLQALYTQAQEADPEAHGLYEAGVELVRLQDLVLDGLLESAERELQRKSRWVESALRRQTWDHAQETLEALQDALRYHASILEASGERGAAIRAQTEGFIEDAASILQQTHDALADGPAEVEIIGEATVAPTLAPLLAAEPAAMQEPPPAPEPPPEPAPLPVGAVAGLSPADEAEAPLRELFPAAHYRLAQLHAILDRAAAAAQARDHAVVERHLVRVSEEWRAFDAFYGRRLPTPLPEVDALMERLRVAAARLQAAGEEAAEVVEPVMEPVMEPMMEPMMEPVVAFEEEPEEEDDALEGPDTGTVSRGSGEYPVALEESASAIAALEDPEGPASGAEAPAYDLHAVRDYAEDDAAIEAALGDAFDFEAPAATPEVEEETSTPVRLRFSSSPTDPWAGPEIFVAGQPVYGHLRLPATLGALTGEVGLQTSVQVRLVVDGEEVATHTFYPEEEVLEQRAVVIDVVPDPEAESPQWNSRIAEELSGFAGGRHRFVIEVDSKTNATGAPLATGELALRFQDDGEALLEVSEAVRRARRAWRDAGL